MARLGQSAQLQCNRHTTSVIEHAADLAFKQMEAGRTRWRFTSDTARMASIAAVYAQTSNSRLCCANADDLFVDEQLAAKYFGRGGSQWVYGELTLDGCLTMLNARYLEEQVNHPFSWMSARGSAKLYFLLLSLVG